MSVLNTTRYAAVISSRTSDVPAVREDVKYTAIADESVSTAGITLPIPTIPIGSLLVPLALHETLPTDALPLIVPAEVGDPCWIVRVRGMLKLIVDTEKLTFSACGSGGGGE